MNKYLQKNRFRLPYQKATYSRNLQHERTKCEKRCNLHNVTAKPKAWRGSTFVVAFEDRCDPDTNSRPQRLADEQQQQQLF